MIQLLVTLFGGTRFFNFLLTLMLPAVQTAVTLSSELTKHDMFVQYGSCRGHEGWVVIVGPLYDFLGK